MATRKKLFYILLLYLKKYEYFPRIDMRQLPNSTRVDTTLYYMYTVCHTGNLLLFKYYLFDEDVVVSPVFVSPDESNLNLILGIGGSILSL